MYKILVALLHVFVVCSCGKVSLEIHQGKLIGKTAVDRKGNEFYSFLSIPYARAPLGDLRFKAPQKPDSWPGVLDATVDLPECSQLHLGKVVGQEDCLYLNVHTPKIQHGKKHSPLKPVFFYIHGGAFIEGSGSAKNFGAEFLMPADVVLVTINYRLGLFGFLSSENDCLGFSGNAALKDQNMALRWVQKNIKKFGGDPDNVMIVGESAGGASVHFHMLSTASKGLFHKVISMSGTAANVWARGVPGTLENVIGERLGVTSGNSSVILEELMKLPTANILNFQKQDGLAIPVHKPFECSPIIEKDVPGAFITKPSLEIIRSGRYNKVPFMLGYTDKDGLFREVINRLYFGKPYVPTDLSEMVPSDLNPEGGNLEILMGKLKRFYFGDEEPSEGNLDKSVSMFTGVWFLSGIARVLKEQVAHQVDSMYLYRFTADTSLNYFKRLTPETAKVKGTCHIDDLGYLFNNDKTPEIQPGSPEDLAIDNAVKLFTDFAKFGKPSKHWLPVTSDKRNFMDIGVTSKAGVDPDKEQFQFWAELYKQYSL